MGNPYVFSIAEDTEDDSDYVPGGFFPVKLGDVLGPEGSAPDSSRYRISAKLGYGTFSTVWLARDLVAKRTVAVKIIQASEYATSSEVAILKRLRTSTAESPAVLQLLDSFKVTSGNGIHQAIVTEPVILLERFLKLRGIKVNTRSLVRQALEGLAFIHERGIAHGDLYPSNIGVAVPDLDSFSEVDIWEMGGPPTILPLVTDDPAYDATSFPPYLMTTLDLGELLERDVPGFLAREPRVRILDLGCAYFAEEGPSPRSPTPAAYAPPEVAFPMIAHGNRDAPWDRSADIWSMACSINDIAGGVILFGSQILSEMAALCGGAPADWTAYFATVPDKIPPRGIVVFMFLAWFAHAGVTAAYTREGADALWVTKADEYLKRARQTTEQIRGFVALLRRMLVLDPMQRPSALELLQDPYFELGREGPTTTTPSEGPSSIV
ncbi:kinase-like domain-containing protein [Mycena polygramma]|nr:kinase-like domain-containing protein [Mycena polygramma]